MIYNVNQNRQLYVITAKATTTPASEGQYIVKNNGEQFWVNHFGKGGLTRSDMIDLDKICYAKLTSKDDMREFMNEATVTLIDDVNEGKPILGQDYILRIQINNYLAPGDACVLIKSSAVHVTSAITSSTNPAKAFYEKMAESIKLNFSREAHDLISVTGDADGIHIKGLKNQPWRLGVLSQEVVKFEVVPTTVRYQGDEVIWGTVETSKSTTEYLGNGTKVADLEYFCQAERGDMFRNMGWPNNIDVKYMVDPTKEYDILDIHYYYSGNGVDNHKSEKDITFVGETAKISELKTTLTGLGITVKE